jgi:hypothetical protein
MVKWRSLGGMTERLKVLVLKTSLGHTNVGSNPTPSASIIRSDGFSNHPRATDKRSLLQILGEVPEWLNGLAC